MAKQDATVPEPQRSAIYTGSVIHRRYRPRVHKLKYSVFWLLLDLDEIDSLSGRSRIFSRNRFNLFSFFDRDYVGKTARPIREQIDGYLTDAGIPGGGRIEVLTMPRILGYAFNPLSVFYCYDRAGALSALLYEVSNTFGERHSYLIPVTNPNERPIRQSIEKSFFVSPFLEMNLHYDFRMEPPQSTVAVGIAARDAEGPMINAVLRADRVELTDKALLRAFVQFPLLTLKVVAGIHWEAVLLVLKRVGLKRKPEPPLQPVSLGSGFPSGTRSVKAG